MRLKKLLQGLRIFLLSFLILQAFPAGLKAQQINLNQKDVSIKEVLKAVTQQTGYKFVYSDELKELDHKVSVTAANEPLETFLNKILANQKIVYKVEGKQVLLSSKEISAAPAAGQTIAIKGKVVDKDTGEPIPFASIYIKENKSIGIETTLDGDYSLINVNPNHTLVVSYIGYVTTEVPVANKGVISQPLKSILITDYQ